jgi:hypothetical protein
MEIQYNTIKVITASGNAYKLPYGYYQTIK